MTLSKVPKVLLDSANMSAMLLYIITNAVMFSYLMTSEQIPQELAAWMLDKGLGVVAFLLVTLSERRRRFRILACLPCAATVSLVAASRIYLDMHWLSDVVGGFVLGTAYLLLALWAHQRLFVPRPAAAAAESVPAVSAA